MREGESTWTPSSSAASLTVAAIASTVVPSGWPTVAPTEVQAATITCTPPSTTTPT